MNPPLFEKLVTATLSRCTAIFKERGGQYGDTWAEIEPLCMKAVARKLGAAIPEDAFRALVLAALSDVKYWRFLGGYKQDSVDDGINYMAAMDAEVERVMWERVQDQPNAKQLQMWGRVPHLTTCRQCGATWGDNELAQGLCPKCLKDKLTHA